MRSDPTNMNDPVFNSIQSVVQAWTPNINNLRLRLIAAGQASGLKLKITTTNDYITN